MYPKEECFCFLSIGADGTGSVSCECGCLQQHGCWSGECKSFRVRTKARLGKIISWKQKLESLEIWSCKTARTLYIFIHQLVVQFFLVKVLVFSQQFKVSRSIIIISINYKLALLRSQKKRRIQLYNPSCLKTKRSSYHSFLSLYCVFFSKVSSLRVRSLVFASRTHRQLTEVTTDEFKVKFC